MKLKWTMCAVLILGLAFAAVADNRLRTLPASDLVGRELVNIPADLLEHEPTGTRQVGVLLGDTIFVGASTWDDQHNAGAARQICYQPGDQWLAQVVFTKLSGVLPGDPRHVRAIRVREDEFGNLEIWPVPSIQVDSQYRSGYAGMVYSVLAETPLLVYHGAETAGDDYFTLTAIRDSIDPNTFNEYTVPGVFPQSHLWPRAIAGADGYLHIVSHSQRVTNTDPISLSYMRYSIDPLSLTLTPATIDNNPVLITSEAMNISSDIATTIDGQTIAIASCVSRHETRGERWGGLSATQVNNDVYVYQSIDGGQTWDLNNPKNLTQFIGPVDEVPNDTMRAYADCGIEFTTQNKLRAAFTVAHGNAVTGESFYESRLYSYVEDDDGFEWWSQIHYQPDPGYPPETWGRTADRPSLFFDSLTGVLWCMFRSFGGGEHDYSESTGIGNGDLYITASPPGLYNGLLWAKPVNITYTNWDIAGGAGVGQSASELDGALAINSNGPYLHLSYLLDIEAGIGVASPAEGTITNNPYVYHRVLKEDLFRDFELNAEWVVNYPMHHDSTGFWQDPGNYEWHEHGGFFTGVRLPLPVTLTLGIIDFTIPPGGGTGLFNATINSTSPQTFTDVDFWTMITTPRGNVFGPGVDTTLVLDPFGTWVADTLYQDIPASAPGGSYFVVGHLGYYPFSYVQDVIELFKFGEVADGQTVSFDPNDWLGYGTFQMVTDDDSAADAVSENSLPTEFSMSAAYPNPFNPETSVSLYLDRSVELTVEVFSVTGRRVATIAEGVHGAGIHELSFNGSGFASGLYFIHAHTDQQTLGVQKVTLLK